MKTFRNRQDVLQYFGVDDEKGLSRAIYKSTDCGAWAAFETIKTSELPEVWVAHIRRSITGPRLISARRKGERSTDRASLPAYVMDYLTVSQDSPKIDLTNEELLALKPNGDDMLKVTIRNHDLDVWVTFQVKRPVLRDGIAVGSIVEGTDAEVWPEHLTFPFTYDDLDRAIGNVDKAANDIWNETHGCDDCNAGEGEYGGKRIDPDCKTCGGHGVVI
jgi:hypothetical protein